MDILLIFLSGFFLGFMVAEFILVIKINRAMNDLQSGKFSNADIDTKNHIFKLYVESEQDMLYLYDSEKNEFVCQANTVEDLAKLAKQYKNIKYAAVLHGDDSFMFVDGDVRRKL